MILYILREIKRGALRKYTGVYLLGFLALCIIGNLAMAAFRSIYGMNDGSYTYNLITFAQGAFILPYYSCIALADIIFGKEYPDPYLKDGVTRKLHRYQLYLGKLIAAVILSIGIFVIAFGMLLIVTSLFGIGYGSIDMLTIMDFLNKSTLALPLWIAGISIGQMCLYLFPGRKKRAVLLFAILVVVIPRFIMLLASEAIGIAFFVRLTDFIITPQFQALQFLFTMNRGRCCILGLVYTILSSAVGIWALYRYERKQMDEQ